jgi:hypothetical protein
MLPIAPTRKAMGQTKTARIKKTGSSMPSQLNIKLCKTIKTRIAVVEAPASKKNALSNPAIFCSTVKTINVAPNKNKTVKGIKNNLEPAIKAPNTGMKRKQPAIMATTTNAQNIDQSNASFILTSVGKEHRQTNSQGNDANRQQDIKHATTHFLTPLLRRSYVALFSFLIALPDLKRFMLTKPLVRFTTHLFFFFSLKAKM